MTELSYFLSFILLLVYFYHPSFRSSSLVNNLRASKTNTPFAEFLKSR